MPVYNEGGVLERVLTDWISVAEKFQAKLLLVDDGSTDLSVDILERWSNQHACVEVIHQINQGHGSALIRGYSEALEQKVEYIFQTDSDGQFVAGEFETFWNERATADLIIGRRNKRADGLLRKMLSLVLKWAIRLLCFKKIYDSNVPFRLMNRSFLDYALKQINLDYFAPNIFMSILATKNKWRLKQMPVTHMARLVGRSSLFRYSIIKIGIRVFFELIVFLKLQYKARYKRVHGSR
jgi:dolichol-phosphate mannosyltransferase